MSNTTPHGHGLDDMTPEAAEGSEGADPHQNRGGHAAAGGVTPPNASNPEMPEAGSQNRGGHAGEVETEGPDDTPAAV